MQMYPWRHLTHESLMNGILPFWNPYQFTGMPFMAAMKPMVFYPINVFFGLGEIQSWHILLIFQTFAGAVFTYLLLQNFKLKKIPSMLAGISFAFSSLMVGVMEFGSEGNVLLWYPFFLLFVKRYLDSKKKWNLLVFGLGVVCAIFAGHLQYLGYGLIITALFAIFYGRYVNVKKKSYIAIVIVLVLSFGIGAVQLLPGIEMFKYSYRGIADSYNVFAQGLLKPYQLVRLIAPDFFGHPMTKDLVKGYIEQSGYFGIIPLFFAIYAMVRSRKNLLVRILTIIFSIGILFSIDGIAQILYFLKIPIITSGYGGRIFSMSLFSGALLSAYGLTEFFQNHDKKKLLYTGAYIGILVIIFAGSLIFKFVPFVHLKFPMIILFIFGALMMFYYVFVRRFPKITVIIFSIGILLCTYADLFRLGYRFLTFSNSKFLYPETNVVTFVKKESRETMDRVYGLTEPELSTYLGVSSIETYNPLYSIRTAQLFQTLNGKDPNKLPVNKYILDKTETLKNVLDVTGTSLIVVGKGENPATKYFLSSSFEKDLTKIYGDEQFEVYRNTSAYPRFSLYYKAVNGLSDRAILEDIQKGKTNMKDTVLLEKSLPISLEMGTGSAKLVASTVNSQTFDIDSNSPALFYVSDTYYPGWKAYVNKKETEIFRTNYNFRSVLIPNGQSTVEFRYQPTNWNMYIGLSGVSFLLLVIFCILL